MKSLAQVVILDLSLPIVNYRKEGYSKQMEIKGSNFTAFFDSLTKNTSVLLIISDTGISKYIPVVDYSQRAADTFLAITTASAATQVNIAAARRHFEKLEHVEAA